MGVNQKGHLTIGDQDVVYLAHKFGTPLWVISEETLRGNYRTFKSAFQKRYPDTTIVYASKANHEPAILRIMSQEGAWVDVVTLTQLRLAEFAGVPPETIVFNGNNKSASELELAVQMGVAFINIDNFDELQLLSEICTKCSKRAKVNIRIRPAMRKLAKTDPKFVKQALHKFGFDVSSGQALEAFRRALETKLIDVKGVSHHIGWTAYNLPYDKKLDLERTKTETEEVVQFAAQLKEHLGFVPSLLDLGGGYRKQRRHGFGPSKITSFPTINEYANQIVSVIKGARSVLGEPRLLLEPGGYIVTDAVTLLSTVGSVKHVKSGPGAGKLVAVDSSAYMFARKLIFNFYHHSLVANKVLRSPSEIVDIAGSTCAYDYIADKVKVPPIQKGDIVATLDQGSYCETISTQYCGIPRPAAILVDKQGAELVRRRETTEDIIAQYVVPARLAAEAAKRRT